MTDGDTIAQVAVVILLLSLAAPALITAHDYAGTPIEYSEDVSVDYTSDSEVAANATQEGYSESVTITTSSGDTLAAGSDYAWNASTGTISWYNTSNTTSGATATVEYGAHQRTANTQVAWTILAPLMSLFGLFGFVAGVRGLLTYIGEVWDLS